MPKNEQTTQREADCAPTACSGRVFDDALAALVKAAEELNGDAGQAHRLVGFHQHKLEQIEVHLRGVVSGKFDGEEIAAFLLNEYFKAPNEKAGRHSAGRQSAAPGHRAAV